MSPNGWGWGRVRCVILNKYNKEQWFHEVLSYIIQRHSSIESRLIETFRYVDCHPNNRDTFSYEYASILRDAGSVFGSVMDRLVKETGSVSGLLDIGDYREWLRRLEIPHTRNRVERIHSISVDINYPSQRRALLPFLQFKDENGVPKWWNAYNAVKHRDIDEFRLGNLENALNSVGALTILLALCQDGGEGRLLVNPGFYEPEEYLQSLLFFAQEPSAHAKAPEGAD